MKKELIIPSNIKVVLKKNWSFILMEKNKDYKLDWNSWEITQENYKDMLDFDDIENLRNLLKFKS